MAGGWKVAWITGASTGIGAEIARQLAAEGVVVAATARHPEKIAGPNIHPYAADVTDPAALAETFARIERELGPVDLALFCAGAYSPVGVDGLDPKTFRALLDVNYLGVVNALAACLPAMRARRSGQIAWMASVAGYRGLPKAAAYGPGKAALINLAESLKVELEQLGITLSVINPSFVRTPMTAGNDFPMPFLMEPEDAARRTVAGLKAGRFEIAYPGRFVAILKTARILPYWLYFWLIRTFIAGKRP
jgi:NAD(P)-dependent dehydrogenase (short-subunit alcohol dehydrogenase family)